MFVTADFAEFDCDTGATTIRICPDKSLDLLKGFRHNDKQIPNNLCTLIKPLFFTSLRGRGDCISFSAALGRILCIPSNTS